MRRPLFTKSITVAIAIALMFATVPITNAADIPLTVRQAIVLVKCGNRQGSGVVVNGKDGYVLTNAHVVVDVAGTQKAENCSVGFAAADTEDSNTFYRANWIRYIYDESTNRDFALLRIIDPNSAPRMNAFPSIATDEFSEVGESLSIVGYPGSAHGMQAVTSGSIKGLERGIIKTDAVIAPGTSGGAGLNRDNHLIGLATRILVKETEPGVEEVVHYELVDIRAILAWLDTAGPQVHDLYITHTDPARYHGPQLYISSAKLDCALLAKTTLSSTVSCLRNDGTRSVFPDAQTFLSWFADFSAVATLPLEEFSEYRPSALVTMKSGSLIKIESDPRVYLVSDSNGTLRLIPNEATAKKLFGAGWAGFVYDVPVSSFVGYRVGEPLPE